MVSYGQYRIGDSIGVVTQCHRSMLWSILSSVLLDVICGAT